MLISALIAFLRGFVKEVLTIFGLVGASAAAYFCGPLLESSFQEWLIGDNKEEEAKSLWGIIPMDLLGTALAYGAVFIVVFIVLTILSFYIAKIVDHVGLNAIDRSLGVVFGILRGVILIMLLYLPFSLLMEEEEYPEWIKESKTIPYIESSITWTEEIFGRDAEKMLEEQIGERKKGLSETINKMGSKLSPETIDQIGDKLSPEALINQMGYEKKDRSELNDLINQGAKDPGSDLNE